MDDKESSPVAFIISLQEMTDENQARYFFLTVQMENGNTRLLSMTEHAAAQLFALLGRAHEKLGWRLLDVPINEDTTH
jgi:hypothetical protein